MHPRTLFPQDMAPIFAWHSHIHTQTHTHFFCLPHWPQFALYLWLKQSQPFCLLYYLLLFEIRKKSHSFFSLSLSFSLLSCEHMLYRKMCFTEIQTTFFFLCGCWYFGDLPSTAEGGETQQGVTGTLQIWYQGSQCFFHCLPPICLDWIDSKLCTVCFTLICQGTPMGFSCLVSLLQCILWPVDTSNYTEKKNFPLLIAKKAEWRLAFDSYQHLSSTTAD